MANDIRKIRVNGQVYKINDEDDYTREQVNELFYKKTESDSRYISRQDANDLFEQKGSSYTKEQANERFPTKADVADEHFSKTESDGRYLKRTEDAGYYTKSEVNEKLANMESTTNKVSSLGSSSNNTQYPSAKAVYDYVKGRVSVSGNRLIITIA